MTRKTTAQLTGMQILDLEDLQSEEVAIPEWKGTKVFVREMDGDQRDEYDDAFIKANRVEGSNKLSPQSTKGLRALVIVMCARDLEGNLLFKMEDREQLSKKSSSALSRIHRVAARLSGLDDEEDDDSAKNSETPSGKDSGSE